jgi:hypothetical protein
MNIIRNLAIAFFWGIILPLGVVSFAIAINNHDKAMAIAYAGK